MVSHLPKRERAYRVDILVKRREGAGYDFFSEDGRLIKSVYYNDPQIDRRMGQLRKVRWWRASYDPKTGVTKLLQARSRPVKPEDTRR